MISKCSTKNLPDSQHWAWIKLFSIFCFNLEAPIGFHPNFNLLLNSSFKIHTLCLAWSLLASNTAKAFFFNAKILFAAVHSATIILQNTFGPCVEHIHTSVRNVDAFTKLSTKRWGIGIRVTSITGFAPKSVIFADSKNIPGAWKILFTFQWVWYNISLNICIQLSGP